MRFKILEWNPASVVISASMAKETSYRPLGRAGLVAAWIVLGLWLSLIIVPWSPRPIATRAVDASYMFFAHESFAHHQPWGSEIFDTNGPWGFLRFPLYHSRSFPWVVAAHVLLAFGLSALALAAARSVRRTRLALAGLACASLLMAGLPNAPWCLFLLGVVLAAPARPRPATFLGWLCLAFGAGVTALAHGMFLVATLAWMALLLYEDIQERRVPTGSVVLALALVAAYTLSGSDFALLPRFLVFVYDGIRVYPETFSFSGDPRLAAVLYLMSLFALCVVAVGEWTSGGARRLVRIAFYGLVLWMICRHGLVREDRNHLEPTFAALSLFIAGYGLLRWAGITALLQKRLPLSAARAVVLIAIALPLLTALGARRDSFLLSVSGQVQGFCSMVRHGTAPLEIRQQANLEKLRRAVPLPATASASSWGVFGTFQTPLFAYGIQQIVLPAASHYGVWSRRALDETTRFLRSRSAPEHLLLTGTCLGASVAVAMTEQYETETETNQFIILKRRPAPLKSRLVPVLERDVDWNEPVAVPAEFRREPLIAFVDITMTWKGWVVAELLRPPEAYLTMTGPDLCANVRLSPAIEEDGVVAGACRSDNWDSRGEALHSIRHGLLNPWHGKEVDTLGFMAQGPNRHDGRGYFLPRIHLRLFQIVFDPGPNVPAK
jgi:hypothetical protein